MNRTIIFGDIHACADEWQALMDKIGVTAADRLISVGDLVCKGPSTRKTLDLARSLPNLECVKGNHEVHMLKFWKHSYKDRVIKDYQIRAFDELGSDVDDYMQYLESWPFYIEEKDFIVVHGGIQPGINLSKQDPRDLVTLRMIGDHAWHELYKEKKLIVYGHWAIQGLHVRENSIGLDSGCVYGKELSAVILPERKIVSVSAKKAYVVVD